MINYREVQKKKATIMIGLYKCMQKKKNKVVVFDEFTSSQNRVTARLISNNVCQFARENKLKLILVACHEDLFASDGLVPDWWFSTKSYFLKYFNVPKSKSKSSFTPHTTKIMFEQPVIHLLMKQIHRSGWDYFKKHHYKDPNIRNFARSFCVYTEFQKPYGDIPKDLAGWICAIPSQDKDAVLTGTGYMEHRTVVLPDFQGLGFGSRMCDCVGELFRLEGSLFVSKTAHPRYGQYRNENCLWQAKKGNGKMQKSANNWKDPFKTKEEREENPAWKTLGGNWKAKPYYIHRYLGCLDK
eukprot:UN22746